MHRVPGRARQRSGLVRPLVADATLDCQSREPGFTLPEGPACCPRARAACKRSEIPHVLRRREMPTFSKKGDASSSQRREIPHVPKEGRRLTFSREVRCLTLSEEGRCLTPSDYFISLITTPWLGLLFYRRENQGS